ncbi:ATP-binding protein [Nonomuraea diastatica]|uniref:ATP-binding protein n=1 Tax=Nonomuraea diastatica TaxID=1848329 RepID=UPI001FEC6585
MLADRGLAGAVEAAALHVPLTVDVDIDLPARPEAPVESAAYFAAAEALTNAAKHSDAHRAWVRLRHSGGVLRLVVGDDGRGGADPCGTGIRRRLSAFDGTLEVRSPAGGPTEFIVEIPCALSSQKISPS